MNDVVKIAEEEIKKLGFTANGQHIKTGDIRKLSAKLYRSIGDKSKDTVFLICESLLEQRNWPMEVIAFDFAYRVKNSMTKIHFRFLKVGLLSMLEGGETVMIFALMALVNLSCKILVLYIRLSHGRSVMNSGYVVRRL